MKLTNQVEEARSLLDEAITRLDDQDAKIQALPDDAPAEEVEFQRALFGKFEDDVTRRRETVERLIAIQRAREAIPPVDTEAPARGDELAAARARIDVLKEPHTYRPDVPHSFFRDLYTSKQGDIAAQERLQKHQKETRDVTTADPGAGVFLPPQYLSALWAEAPREGRPFADILRKMPLVDSGLSITIPRVTTATAVGVQAAEANAVTETDIDGTLLTVPVRTIAGQQDLSRQAFERTMPGMDFLIFQDLRADYDEQLDTQLLAGTGSSGQHLGVRAVSSINTVTYTDASPTTAEALPKLYDAIQKIATVRFRQADTMVIHPRRAAWFASNLSTSFPLFQLGSLNQAVGQQQGGFMSNFAGLRNIVLDANISTEYGASTDEDEIYVLYSPDLILMEGPLRTAVYEDVLSGTLQVRMQLFAYSAFISGRQPGSITKISGTGFKAPTF